MTLDPEFAKQTTDLIVQTLELYKKSEHLQSWRSLEL